ncbi:MAG: helix-turn-helix transcriptional regulator [Oscillospiraceae bacterium]|nr:helix-turn-helix transcriptional regulator [Oscillospiraceae bacterium]
MTLGDKLSKLRKEANYTQEQFAELLGVSRQSVSKWESDVTYPETEKLIRIGELFDCSLDYLLLEKEASVTDERQNDFGGYTLSGDRVFIESPLTNNLVSCFKVTASPVMAPAKKQPKYLLLGADRVTVFGEHTTPLGWYETEEEIQKEISEITSAIRKGENCYTLKYAVEMDTNSLGAVMEKTKVQAQDTPYPFGKGPRERKSKKTIWGMPLWHVGRNARGFVAVGLNARGVIAVGLKARGVVSFGLLSIGVLSYGLLSLGLLSIGTVALGLLAAGSISAGVFSAGAVSFGIISLGAVAIGDFSVGALAVGNYFALGDNARAMIAIGDTEAVGSAFQRIGELTTADAGRVKELLDTIVPGYLSWAKEFIKLFL